MGKDRSHSLIKNRVGLFLGDLTGKVEVQQSNINFSNVSIVLILGSEVLCLLLSHLQPFLDVGSENLLGHKSLSIHLGLTWENCFNMLFLDFFHVSSQLLDVLVLGVDLLSAHFELILGMVSIESSYKLDSVHLEEGRVVRDVLEDV